MSSKGNFTNMRSLVTALAKAMNLVNPEVEHHHEQTAYLAYFIASAMGLAEEERRLALYAALLHDIGSIVIEEAPSVTEIEQNARELSAAGARMVEDLDGFADIAGVIRYCQCSWRETVAAAIEEGRECERLGNIASVVHLADTVSLLVRPEERVLNQVKRIKDVVSSCAGSEFSPRAVDAFLSLADTEYIWMDLAHNPSFLLYFTGDLGIVSLDQAVRLTDFMTRIIDYRSPFTAMHSAGVAASARVLSELAGMGPDDVLKMQIAGNLHDVGKLVVPRSILEKPGRLTEEEFNVMREHPYYTSLVLLEVDGFGDIRHWAANHHEKLTGAGYPFHYRAGELDLGDRIMAVADIFSAITEERPYRPGMSREKASEVLSGDAAANAICSDVVDMLLDNYELVDAAREESSRRAGGRYFESLGQEAA